MSGKSNDESSGSDREGEEEEYTPKGPRKMRNSVTKVTATQKKNDKKHKCEWCNKLFYNRGNLVAHSTKMHKQLGLGKPTSLKRVKCNVCDVESTDSYALRLHIRREHYNLKSKVPSCELKKVNQVWFEKVINSDSIMEIKKTGENTLVMRKLGLNTAIKVIDSYRPEIDLTNMYTLKKTKKGKKCPYCNKFFMLRSYKKHLEEKHLNLAKHKCNNCNVNFKRLYLYLKHVCFANKRRRNQKGDLIIIDDNDT